MSAFWFVAIGLLSVAALAFTAGWAMAWSLAKEQMRDMDRRTLDALRRLGVR